MVSALSQLKTGASPQRHALAQSVQSRARATKVAIAIGAGFCKAFDGRQFYRLRSLVTRNIPLSGAGSSKQLRVHITHSPYAGEFAVGENLESSAALQSLKDGLKAEWYAPLSLAVLAHLTPAEVDLFNVALVCSIPTPNMVPRVRQLQGTHDVTVNGGRRVVINVSSVRPVPEGLGTACYLAGGQPVAVVDFGYQNTTVAGYDPAERQMIDVVSLKTGVGALFEAIADLCNTTGERPSAEQIRLGIEARTFELDGYSGESFKAHYEKAFEPWLKARIQDAKAKAGHVFGRCPVKVFAGGGSQLPGVSAVGDAMGIQVCPYPQEAEVKGIYRM
jgi:hypothetical protein